MASIKELTQGESGRIYKVTVGQVIVEKDFNHRIDFGDIESMADSIEVNHVRTPLEVFRRGDQLILNDGERRLRGCWRLLERGGSLDWIPVVVVPEEKTDRRLITQYVKNDGKPFTPIEEAQLFAALRKGDAKKEILPMSITQISKEVGKSPAYVADRLVLCDADPELITLLKKKKVGVTLVTEAVKTSKANGATPDQATKAQKKIAKVARNDKKAAKKMAITDSKGAFYMRKNDQELIRQAIDQAMGATDPIEAAMHAGVIRGICMILGATCDDLRTLSINVKDVPHLKMDF